MMGNYVFSYGEADSTLFAANFTAGVNLLDMITISYTLRTDFAPGSASSKIAVGYSYRFK